MNTPEGVFLQKMDRKNFIKTCGFACVGGIGMATLVSVCLQDITDVPYYDLTKPDMIRLVIPSGKLIDEEIGFWLSSFKGYLEQKLGKNLTTEYHKVLAYIYKSEKLNYRRFYTILLSESNNHFEVVDSLKKAGLIVEHPTSKDEAPVYILERELLKNTFDYELDAIIKIHFEGSAAVVEFRKLDSVQKIVLNIIYRNNKYNQQSMKPNKITPEVYLKEKGKEIVPKDYESLGRKVRQICERFWKVGLLVKDETKGYMFPRLIE